MTTEKPQQPAAATANASGSATASSAPPVSSSNRPEGDAARGVEQGGGFAASFERAAQQELYAELLFAGYFCPRLEEYIIAMCAEGCGSPPQASCDSPIIGMIRQLIPSDAFLRAELSEAVVSHRLVVLAEWLAITETSIPGLVDWLVREAPAQFSGVAEGLVREQPARFVELAGAFARADMSQDVKKLAAACDFEGCSHVSFPIDEAQAHEAELKKDSQLRDRAFMLAAVANCPSVCLYLCSLDPSREAKVKALIAVCDLGVMGHGELFKVLFREIDEAAMLALRGGSLAAVVDLYYFAKDKMALCAEIIAKHQWHVARALVAANLLPLDRFEEQVKRLAPDSMKEVEVMVVENDLDLRPNVAIPVNSAFRGQTRVLADAHQCALAAQHQSAARPFARGPRRSHVPTKATIADFMDAALPPEALKGHRVTGKTTVVLAVKTGDAPANVAFPALRGAGQSSRGTRHEVQSWSARAQEGAGSQPAEDGQAGGKPKEKAGQESSDAHK